jgi:hypothetical protein
MLTRYAAFICWISLMAMLLLISPCVSMGQFCNGSPGSSQVFLNINNVQAHLLNDGRNFMNAMGGRWG